MNLPETTIHTRRELTSYIHDVMVGSSARWARERKHHLGVGRVKAYLLDVHQHHDDVQSGVFQLFSAAAEQEGGSVSQTQDAGLYMLRVDEEAFVLDAVTTQVRSGGVVQRVDRGVLVTAPWGHGHREYACAGAGRL